MLVGCFRIRRGAAAMEEVALRRREHHASPVSTVRRRAGHDQERRARVAEPGSGRAQ